jgi:2-polyprenyl-3-methyl-5-hydroxy-6-metoxy-1,4-benzoquinol methylase
LSSRPGAPRSRRIERRNAWRIIRSNLPFDGPVQVWNANIQYHALLVAAIPHEARRVLDVGCGDGILAAQVAHTGVPHVVALDVDPDVLDRARARHRGAAVEWQQGDIFDVPFEPGSFDAVLSVATLHHLNAEDGLVRFADLVRPGGVVTVVGLAANSWWDLPYALAGHSAQLVLVLVRRRWQHSARNVWPPPATYREMKRVARRVLPGVRYTALHRIAAALIQSDADFALIGGLAVSVRTELRFTRDADFAVAVASDGEAEALVRRLRAHGYQVAAVVEQEAVERLATVRLTVADDVEGPVIDLLFASSGIERDVRGCGRFARAAPGVTLKVARIEHLIALKVLSRDDDRRPQDLVGLRALLRTATKEEAARAREAWEAWGLIAARGYHRGRELAPQLEALGRKGLERPHGDPVAFIRCAGPHHAGRHEPVTGFLMRWSRPA